MKIVRARLRFVLIGHRAGRMPPWRSIVHAAITPSPRQAAKCDLGLGRAFVKRGPAQGAALLGRLHRSSAHHLRQPPRNCLSLSPIFRGTILEKLLPSSLIPPGPESEVNIGLRAVTVTSSVMLPSWFSTT